MLIIKHTVATDATPAQIWHVWQDVPAWNSWDHTLEASAIDGSFTAGTPGKLKFKDGTELKTILTHVDPGTSFVQEAKLFLAKAVMSHYIHEVDGKTYVTVQTDIKGPLALVYKLFIGRSIKKKVPLEVEAMLKKAKGYSPSFISSLINRFL